MAPATHERVSAVIPARNEAETIARTVRSVAAQAEAVEIIVVDDHSDDATPSILEVLKLEIPRLRTLRVDDPPAGWLGKAHALAAGARAASGDWLLFTDADTEHHPGSLGQVLERARRAHADVVSLSPGQQTPTWWEKAIIPFVFAELARRFRFEQVNDPSSKIAAANGQYLLIRRLAYEATGGHTAVRGEILEDVALARRLKWEGRRLLFLPGAEWVTTRMYRSFGAMWDGWRKNLYLLWDRSAPKVLLTLLRVWFVDLAPLLGGLLGLALGVAGSGGAPAAAGLGCLAIAAARRVLYGRELARIGFAPGLANYGAIGAALFGALQIDSLVAHRWLGSVRWKGRRYSTGGSGLPVAER
ncbi:MAG TPA: glycosyltransferase family 2 protein [Terriglobia bacterium]|nr:glycosyltransferase family 2 protein [Terriglobia bacterium]